MADTPSERPGPDSWAAHFRATLTLGVPLVGIHLAQLAITTTDMIMIGWIGATELAAGVLGGHAFFLLLMLGSGFAHAILPLVAQAEGRGDRVRIRRTVRMGFWIAILFCAVCMVPLWWLESLLLLARQEADVSALAGDYMRILQWSLFPALLILVMRSFLVAIEKPQLVLWNTIATAALNGVLNYMFIFGNWGAPALGIEGAALASVISTALAFLVLLAYATLDRGLRAYRVFARFLRAARPDFQEIMRLGWPISLSIIAEVGLFSASSVMMGWLGTVQLAAHGIALQLASIAFMVPLGLSGVAAVRVGQAAGREDAANLLRASRAVIATGFIAGSLSALLFWVFPARLSALFVDAANPDAAEVLVYSVAFLAIAAAFQLVDNMQAIAMGLLRGLRDTRTPMLIAVLAYWAIGMPAAWLLGFVFGLGGKGIWIGLACGLSVAAVLLLRRFFLLAPRVAPS